jgi:hypothetical protein
MVATMLSPSWDIPLGIPVHTADGERLGFLTDATAYELTVEDGVIFRQTFTVRPSDVDRFDHGVLILSLTEEQVIQRATRP